MRLERKVRTKFAGLPAPLAVLVLGIFLTCFAGLLSVALQSPGSAPAADRAVQGSGDVVTYAAVVERLRAGEHYYEALQAELLAGGFGTRSVFNWRPPIYMSALAALPSLLWAQTLLLAVAGLAASMACRMVSVEGSVGRSIGLGVLSILALAGCLAPNGVLLSEIPAGVLILLSVAAYGLKARQLGFAAAVLALLVRELAALYVIVCLIFALRERRYRELAGWGAVLVGYAAFFLWHTHMVTSLLGPMDRAYETGWVQFGGAAFALATAGFNGAFLLLPAWVTALMLPLSVVGLAAWKEGGRSLATVLAYVMAFAVIGRPQNAYWGAMFTPLLSLGVVYGVAAVADLIAAISRRGSFEVGPST